VHFGAAIFNFYNATSRNRFSNWDVTDSGEEPDPLDPSSRQSFAQSTATQQQTMLRQASPFCPFCGAGVQGEFEFCPRCGKQLPKA
jgi:ribosomal protein S27AE